MDSSIWNKLETSIKGRDITSSKKQSKGDVDLWFKSLEGVEITDFELFKEYFMEEYGEFNNLDDQ